MTQLNQTEPHYIRCIKPNETKSPKTFVARNCFEQLTYSGVFEAVAIRKKGFPFRMPHKEFADRYGRVLKLTKGGSIGGAAPTGDARSICEKVIKHEELPAEDVRMGKTRVLYRAAEYRKLELDRSIIVQHETINSDLDKLMRDEPSVRGWSNDKDDYLMRLAKRRTADEFRIHSSVAERARGLEFIDERMGPKISGSSSKRARARMRCARELIARDENGFVTKLVRKCREMLERSKMPTPPSTPRLLRWTMPCPESPRHVRRVWLQSTPRSRREDAPRQHRARQARSRRLHEARV